MSKITMTEKFKNPGKKYCKECGHPTRHDGQDDYYSDGTVLRMHTCRVCGCEKHCDVTKYIGMEFHGGIVGEDR